MKMQSPKNGIRRSRTSALTLAPGLILGLGISLSALGSPTTLTIDPASVTAGPTPTTLNFNVTRSGDLSYDSYLATRTADGTALAGTDYTAIVNGFTRFAAGATTGVLTVPVAADNAGNLSIDRTLQLIVDGAIGTGPTPAFAAAQSVTTAGGIFETSLADINGDFRPDLLIGVLSSSQVVYVALNTTAPGATTPTFGPAQSFATGSSSIGIVGADIDGDGRPDLVVTVVGNNSVAVLLNTTAPGATTASFAPRVLFPVGNNPFAVRTADFNGDGRPDVVVPNGQSASVSVLINTTVLGSGTPSFVRRDFATGVNPVRNDIADINGDGRPDVVVASFVNGVASVLLNTTAPGATVATFAPAQNFAVGTQPRGIAVSDINGDGRPDLATTNNGNGTLSVLVNTTPAGATTATFAAQQVIPGAPNGIEVIAADVNGDGRPELLVSNPNGSTVTAFQNVTPVGSPTIRFVGIPPFAGGRSNALAVGDVNGDGRPDLLTSLQNPGAVNVLLNTTPASPANTTFAAAASSTVGNAPASVASADFNGDGKPDLAVANFNDNTVSVLLNTTAPGATSTGLTPTASLAVSAGPTFVTVGDFNGDGKPDLVTANVFGNSFSVLLNTTAPGAAGASFAPAVDFTAGLGLRPYSIAVADYNGDGVPDIAVVKLTGGNASILLNMTAPGASSPSFTAPVNLPLGNNQQQSIAAADFNGDGRPDLVTANAGNNNLSILFNTTAPGAASASFAPAGNPATGSFPYHVVTGDFNGDGRPDLAVVNRNDNTVSVLFNTTAPGAASASFALAATVPVGSDPRLSVVGDFDGDGKPDLAVVNGGTNNVSVLLNRTTPGAASASFTLAISPAVGGGPTGLVVADLNNDGQRDLVSADYNGSTGNTVSVLLNTQLQASAAGSPATGTIHFIDSVVAAFSFNAVTDAARNAVITSNTITVSGADPSVSLPITATGGSYSIGCDANFTTAAGTISNGQTVCVRQTSSPAFATTTTATLTIGTASAPFDVTTLARDITPNAFTFVDVTGVATGSFQTSNAIVVSGINDASPVSVTGGFYGINGGPCTQTSGTVTQGDSVVVCHTAASTPFTRTDTTLTIGADGVLTGVSDTFSSTTGGAPAIRLSTRTLDFGRQFVLALGAIRIGPSSPPQTVVLTNIGQTTLNIASISTGGNDFISASNCGATVAPGVSCNISVVFRPSRVGIRTGVTTIVSNAASSPDTIQLRGTGVGLLVLLGTP